MADDIFDVVNENDEVVSSAPRSHVHANRLLHRSAHVLMFAGVGADRKILLQKRSMDKDTYPGVYTTSCSGHIDSGETYDEGVVREMAEETGLKVDVSRLKKIGKISARRETGNEFTFVYEMECRGDEKFTPPPDEVESLEWVAVSEFERMVQDAPKKFTPAFRCVYEFYKSNRPE